MQFKTGLFFLLISTYLIACQGSEPTNTTNEAPYVENENEFVAAVEKAHKKQAFLSKKAIQANIHLFFRGKERMNAVLTMLPNSTKAILDFKDGNRLQYVDDKVYYSPNTEVTKKLRFNAYTWPYFFIFPYKLSDEGTVWTAFEQDTLQGKSYLTQKLNFKAGTGDDPDDWYIVYADKETKLIDVGAYIVTANKTQEEAEQDPHAIQYLDYKEVDGIPIATKWLFWGWRKEGGLTEKIGNAELTNIQFIEVEESYFEPAEGFKELK